ncbi:unnamed protein product [Clavelina lepadiformis]|uniref:Uncharacterized protein n=1 Tax=Clavelina lepadiformis TaxID=159417 RepID=A0ABP0GAL6_CLALP
MSEEEIHALHPTEHGDGCPLNGSGGVLAHGFYAGSGVAAVGCLFGLSLVGVLGMFPARVEIPHYTFVLSAHSFLHCLHAGHQFE